MTKIYHLELRNKDIAEHFYYTSLTALVEDKKEVIKMSIFTLQRAKFPFRNKFYTIHKGFAKTANEVRKAKTRQN